MRVLSLEVSNILSIESALLSFEDNGLVLVEGWNHDTGRANGAGKTAIFNCLSYALYDSLPRKITASEILRRGCKSGHVKCSVVCGEDIWSVQRSRPKGVRFFKNGLEQSISQSEFETFIRLSYDQFLLTIYTPQANSGQLARFLASPDTSKKQFLLQLLNLEKFSDCKGLVDTKIKDLMNLTQQYNSKLESVKSKVDAYTESLVDAEELAESIAQNTISLDAVRNEILQLSKVEKPDLSKYQKLEDDIRGKQNEISKAEVQRSFLFNSYKEISSSLEDYDRDKKCNECGSSLDTNDARLAHKDHQTKALKKISDLKKQIDDLDVILAKKQSVADLAKKLRDKKNSDSSNYQTAIDRISELNSLAKTKAFQIENARSKLNSDSELRSKINSLNDMVSELLTLLASNKRDLELYKTLSSLYSPTGAQAYVLDSIVDSFNEIVQKYIDILWPNASYILNSYKETSKGDVVAKFSETLTLDGKEVSVGSLSGGELKGLSLCIDFALLDVLETQFGLSLNPIILDEPFDGLDAVGREIVIELLETLARNRQILIIDHSSEAKTMFTKSIFVSKKNGVSSISLNP
jgi:DNA repair exonuclease SbcCD ATPase subunit